MAVTITDLAKELNISHSGVSRVLNGRGKGLVRKDVAEKILALAEKRGYRPNVSARTLKTGKSGTVGLVTGEISERYQGCYAQALLNEAERHGYKLLISTTGYNQEKERECLESLLHFNVDGVFYPLHFDSGSDLFKSLKEKNFPLITRSGKGNFSFVSFDCGKALKELVASFKKRNIRKITLLTWEFDPLSKTLAEEAAKQDLGIEEVFFNPLDRYDSSVFSGTMQHHPEAVFSSSHVEIRNLLEHCTEFGLQKPFCAYTWNMPFEFISDPAVIGVIAYPFRKLVENEFALLLEKIKDSALPAREVVLPAEFLDREAWKKRNQKLRSASWYKKYC